MSRLECFIFFEKVNKGHLKFKIDKFHLLKMARSCYIIVLLK